VTERPPGPEDDQPEDENPEFDRFEALTKKLLKAEPRESTEAAEQEIEYPADETDEG
jgi:hypothetical protein